MLHRAVVLVLLHSAVALHGFTIGITGDVNLNPALKTTDPTFVWGDMLETTRAVDVMAIQHEGTLANLTDNDPATIQFEDPLHYEATYKAAGIDFISIANNHQYDFGLDGMSRTIAELAHTGIPFGGLGKSEAEVHKPVVVTAEVADADGVASTVEVAFFTMVVDECWVWPNGTLYLDGCTCGPNADPTSDPPYQCYAANATMPGLWYQFGIDDALITDASSTIRSYKEEHPSQLVVAYLHVGPNFAWVPAPVHEQLLRNISSAGADLVWGTSSHHVQRFEVWEGRPIVYGLGDFLFRHVVGVEDWCPIYARPCADYRPDLSLMYIFNVEAGSAAAAPRINLGNITAVGTIHDHNRTQRVGRPVDSAWLVEAFNRQARGATLVPGATMGTFSVAVSAAAAAAAAAAPPSLPSSHSPMPPDPHAFDWIQKITEGPEGQKIQLDANRTYLIDKQYQLPRGTELRGAGTAEDRRTVIKAVGTPYNACAGTASKAGLVQGRKGLLLGDNTYVGGFHFVGMETSRIDCLYAPIETPGCMNSEGNFAAPPNETGPVGPAGRNLNDCGGYTGNGGHGVSNATVEDVTIEARTTQNMFFMAPNPKGARTSRDIVVRNMRVNGTWADGVNIHGQHSNVLVEGCTVVHSGDDCFAMWSVGTGLSNVTFRNNSATPHPGQNCCYVNFGGQKSTFVDNVGTGCGLTPRHGVPPKSEGLVVYGSPDKSVGLFGGAWNSTSESIVKNVTGTCAGDSGCPTCVFVSKYLYPTGFPGRLVC